MKKNILIGLLLGMLSLSSSAVAQEFTSGKVNVLRTAQFEELFLNDKVIDRPVVIDFSAEWCGWCQKMHPHIAELAQKYSGQIDFYQVNYETDLDLIRALGIGSFPTLVYIKTDGSMVVDENGYRTTSVLDETIQEVFYGK